MTTQHERLGDRSALFRLTGLDLQDFAGRCWGSDRHLARAADQDGYSDLFSLAAAEELISSRGLRTPFVRMVRGGRSLPASRFTGGGGVGATINDQVHDGKVRQLFAEGATVVLQGLHRTWRPIGDFVRELADELGHPVQANGYITPPRSRGFDGHYDVHDVFVVQVHGCKEWILHPPAVASPLRDEGWADRKDAVRRATATTPLAVITLDEGDCLYLPRGFIHSARALGGVSVHLTLGVHPWTTHHVGTALLDAALARLAKTAAGRASLPPGARVDDVVAVEPVRAALLAALAEVPAEQVAAELGKQAGRSMRGAPVPVFDGNSAGEGHA